MAGRTLIRVLFLLGTMVVAGCSSKPSAPDHRQQWLTLDEYTNQPSPGNSYPFNPVVSVPEGAEVELRVSRKPTMLHGDLDKVFFEGLEQVDDLLFVVRLKARKTVYLDLEHLLASTDKESWMSLGFYFFPLFRQSRMTVKKGEGSPEVVVPVTSSFSEIYLQRN